MSRTLHCKIELMHAPIPVWRRFQVRDDYRMDCFHKILQIAMGWTNSHLHEFRIKNRTLAMIDEDFVEDFLELDEVSTVFLKDFKLQPNDKFLYLYDFGDGWEHLITIEQFAEASLLIPFCSEGQNSCPPEDCGGIPGYSNLLTILDTPDHEEYDELVDWLPEGFEPYTFAKDETNRELQLFGQWHNNHPRKKSTPWHEID